MGIDELKKHKEEFKKLKQATEDAYLAYTSFDVDERSSNFIRKFRNKHKISLVLFFIFCIIYCGLLAFSVISISWLYYLLDAIYVIGSIVSVKICHKIANKISKLDYQKKKYLYKEYLKKYELCQELTKKIDSVLYELDEETKTNNKELIESCVKETLEYSVSYSDDIDDCLNFVLMNLHNSLMYDFGEVSENISSNDYIATEQLVSSEEFEPIDQGNTIKLN